MEETREGLDAVQVYVDDLVAWGSIQEYGLKPCRDG